MRPIPSIAGAFSAFLVLAIAGHADDKQPLEPADTSSPRATLESFRAANEEIYRIAVVEKASFKRKREVTSAAERAYDCMDLSGFAEFYRVHGARTAALCLKEVLDRLELPPSEEIPGTEEVEAQDDPVEHWSIPRTEIVFSRITEGPRKGGYRFSAETVTSAEDFYDRIKHLPYNPGATEHFIESYLAQPGVAWLVPVVSALPDWTHARFNSVTVWQWVGMLLTLALTIAAMFWLYRRGHRHAALGPEAGVVRYGASLFFPVLAALLPLASRYVVGDVLKVVGPVLATTKFVSGCVVLLSFLWVVVAAGTRVAEIIIASPRINPRSIDAQFIRLMSRLVSIIGAVVILIEGGKYLGIPLTTLLAGASVGGLALALGAQDMIRNVLGSMMIILDRPYRVGERIIAKGYDGVVEEIGLRSTRLRLLTGHQASIPNEEMAKSDVENVGRRPHIRRVGEIGLPLDIGPQKTHRAVEIIKELLAEHEGLRENFPPRVFLNEFRRDCITITFLYWYHPPRYWDFVAYGQRLNEQILERFAAEDIPMALPASKTIIARESERPLPLPSSDSEQ